MKLTGQAKALFEKWLIDNHGAEKNTERSKLKILIDYAWVKCDSLPEAMQWGVVQEFADSLGYDLHISKEGNGFWYGIEIPDGNLFTNTLIDYYEGGKLLDFVWMYAPVELEKALK